MVRACERSEQARLPPGYRLPPLMLTDDEAAAVVIGLLAAERLGQPMAGISTALAKIQRVLPAALSERVAALRQTLGFTQYQRKPAVADPMDPINSRDPEARSEHHIRTDRGSWSAIPEATRRSAGRHGDEVAGPAGLEEGPRALRRP